MSLSRLILFCITTCLLSVLLLGWRTYANMQPFPATLTITANEIQKTQLLDRYGKPLTITYQNQWNIHDQLALHEFPAVLQQIFILSEDKRFYQHHGVDWEARMNALWQNVQALRAVRGASTITEQVVRLLHPRPRTLWSRWIEGWEAIELEKQFTKSDILEFYLNQMPYASQRRGVVQAARYYFNRDVSTLNFKEMMVLAVLLRSPSRLDPYRNPSGVEKSVSQLAQRLVEKGVMSAADYAVLQETPLVLQQGQLPVQAAHFAQYVYQQFSVPADKQGRLHTTLDANVQRVVQEILNKRLIDLQAQQVNHAAVLVVDQVNQQVLAWVNAGDFHAAAAGSQIDGVTLARQPGSTLKPFLYAVALEKGWTAATLIEDAPLAEAVGTGLHNYRNYSRLYYGALRLRDVLGNSLNIPAIRTIQFVGDGYFLRVLRELGMQSLDLHPDFYGDGLALGNGGVTLFELVQAYTALANRGVWRGLRVLQNQESSGQRVVFTPEVSSIIADILADADARRLEFGESGLLNFPVQTAIKTGTSTDYRDAWAVGFNHRYVVGVWMGNFDGQPMRQVSGSSGAALVLRGILAELNRFVESRPLWRSPLLQQVDICRDSGLRVAVGSTCARRPEWFVAGTEPMVESVVGVSAVSGLDKRGVSVRLRQPAEGLQLALDPRIPDDKEQFMFKLAALPYQEGYIEWLVNDQVFGVTSVSVQEQAWQVMRGSHTAQARVWLPQRVEPLVTGKVQFYVK